MNLAQVKQLQVEARKQRNKEHTSALNSVISACQLESGRGFDIDTPKLYQIIKKEIKAYTDMGRTVEVEYLQSLLPDTLSEDEVVRLLFSNGLEYKNPKQAMDMLDNAGHAGRYDKRLVANLILKR